MKANELMIGDWVMDGDMSTRVTSITCDGIVETMRRISNIEVVEPILLTPEILEKNGFGFIRNDNTDSVWNGWWIYKGLELATACLDKEGNWPCFINIYDSNIKCEYVHQLQHALRLCGIEKEITL